MRGLRTKRVRTVKEGTLIAMVDIGATGNTGYFRGVDGRYMEGQHQGKPSQADGSALPSVECSPRARQGLRSEIFRRMRGCLASTCR